MSFTDFVYLVNYITDSFLNYVSFPYLTLLVLVVACGSLVVECRIF